MQNKIFGKDISHVRSLTEAEAVKSHVVFLEFNLYFPHKAKLTYLCIHYLSIYILDNNFNLFINLIWSCLCKLLELVPAH